MPQFDPTYFAAQIFWLTVIFVGLYLVLSRMVLPRIGGVLQERADRIANDLAKAERMRTEAEKVRGSMEQALQDARNKARDELATVTREISERSSQQLAEQQQRSEQQVNAALQRIAEAKQAAEQDIRQIALELSRDVTSRFDPSLAEEALLEAKVDEVMKQRQERGESA